MRRATALAGGAAVLVAGVLSSGGWTQDEARAQAPPRYRGSVAVRAAVDAWLTEHPDATAPLVYAAGRGGPAWPALEIFHPGGPPPAERTALLLAGGLDGSSLSGGEAVLAVGQALLADPEALPADCTFLLLPWASPEALALALAGGPAARDGRDGVELDEDEDGARDEDGPDDLDGDGQVLEMLVPSPEGAWTLPEGARLPVLARPGDSPRYERVREGRDDDGDGRFNEDGPGGVVLDRNFPLGRRPRKEDPVAGPLPMSAPLARAFADLVLARRVAVVVLFQGDHGTLAAPGGRADAAGRGAVLEEDRPTFARVASIFARATGRPDRGAPPLFAARGQERPGAALDWLYAVRGALAVEVAPWGPGVAPRPEDPASLEGLTIEEAWLWWIDNARGGIGFSAWRPVELSNGRRGLVGGWGPRTRWNPPEELLQDALVGLDSFVLELARALPRVEIGLEGIERDGDLVRFRASVANRGVLPTGLAAGALGAGGARLTIELPPDAVRVAGPAAVDLGRVLGGEQTRSIEWLVVLPEGATVRLHCQATWAAPAVAEVKP